MARRAPLAPPDAHTLGAPPLARRLSFRHAAPLSWPARDAPLCEGNGAPQASWRERAAAHRDRLGAVVAAASRAQEAEVAGQAGLDLTLTVASLTLRARSDDAAAVAGQRKLEREGVPLEAAARDEEDEEESSADDIDAWGAVLRVDLERYAALRIATLRARADETDDVTAKQILEDGRFSQFVCEAVSLERSALRRGLRSRRWPHPLRSPASLPQDESEEFRRRVGELLERLAAQRHRNSSLDNALREWPLDALLAQLLADTYRGTAADDEGFSQAARALLGAVGVRGPAADILPQGRAARFPLLAGWQDAFLCRYVQAEQCVRFAWLTLNTAAGEIESELGLKAPRPRADGDVESQSLVERRILCISRWPWASVCPRATALEETLAGVRRHLVAAVKLYDEELQSVRSGDAVSLAATPRAEWHMVLCCARFRASMLLAPTWRWLALAASAARRSAEAVRAREQAQVALAHAMREASVLQGKCEAPPRLRRLLAAEQRRLAAWGEEWQAAA